MADMNFDRLNGVRRTSQRPASRGANGAATRNYQTMINLAGAATSVALVLGLAVWGYKLAVRDVSGIPVVLALQGPMRVAPATPGGTVADNQGLAVNAIAAEGNAAAPADRLVLAPQAVELLMPCWLHPCHPMRLPLMPQPPTLALMKLPSNWHLLLR